MGKKSLFPPGDKAKTKPVNKSFSLAFPVCGCHVRTQELADNIVGHGQQRGCN